MRAQPVDLIGGYYTDDALSWSCQDTVNWLPVMAEVAGTKTPKKLSTPPGLKPYQKIGTGPIRGVHDLEGGRFVVSGRYLYRINSAGVGIPVGVIPGVGRVTMTHNQFKTGYQLLVENGQGGGGYVYTSSTDTFAKITDEGYPGSISSDYLDSYLLGVEPQGRYWFHSNLADATDYNTLDRYEAEAAPDRIVGLIVSAQEVVVFSQRTTEFFYNTGQATGTFQNKKCGFDRGCASRHTIKKLDNSPIWLGDDGVVYRLDGYSAVPISTRPIEKALAGQNWAEAFAHTWEDRGFKIYYLTLPDGRTWGYDVVSRLWTRRESPGLRRWRLMDTIRWGGKWYGGDFQDGRIWELNWDYYLEGDDEFISERTSPCLQDNRSSLIVPFAELEFDVGQGPMTLPASFPVQPSAPVVTGSAPDGFMGYPFTYTYVATGGTGALTYSVRSYDGSALVGVSINPSTGVASFTAAAAGQQRFYVRATDTLGIWGELLDTIQVVNRDPLPNLVATFFGGQSVSALQYSVVSQSITPLASAVVPGGGSNQASGAIGEVYLAAHSISPFIYAYKRAGGTMTAMAAPSSPLPGRGTTVATLGDVAVIGHVNTPFISAYRINQTTGFASKFTAPASPPPGTVTGIAFHPSGNYIAVVCSAFPYVIAYRWDSTTGFGERLPQAGVQPAAGANGVCFNEAGNRVAVTSSGTNPIRVYAWSDGYGAITSLINPTTFGADGIAISDKAGLLVAGTQDGILRGFAYRWSVDGGIGAPVSIPTAAISGSLLSVDISPDGYLVAFGSRGNGGSSVCEWNTSSSTFGSPSMFGSTSCLTIQFKE